MPHAPQNKILCESTVLHDRLKLFGTWQMSLLLGRDTRFSCAYNKKKNNKVNGSYYPVRGLVWTWPQQIETKSVGIYSGHITESARPTYALAQTVAPSATRTRSFGRKQRQDCATLCAVLQGAVGPLPLQERLKPLLPLRPRYHSHPICLSSS